MLVGGVSCLPCGVIGMSYRPLISISLQKGLDLERIRDSGDIGGSSRSITDKLTLNVKIFSFIHLKTSSSSSCLFYCSTADSH